jgi:RNA polymerase sigma factor (sigma-70 family)
MAPDRHGPVLRQVRTLFTVGTAGGLTDGELLQRFVTRDGDEAELAFAVLVERHGPMVLRVCGQVLGDPHAAEDAFQAAFLVLARKARSFRPSDPIAPWLQQVAWRTASRLRAQAARRRGHERRAAERAPLAATDRGWDDLGEALHEELGRLPARYRLPLVLCYLEGLTSEQAARQLGWPAGTVRSRLTRGRDRLRFRLLRRGLAPSAAALAAALAPRSAWAAVPPGAVSAAARAAVFVDAGRAAAGAVPASILSLTEGVLLDMAMTKWKVAGVALLLSGALAGGAMVPAQSPAPGAVAFAQEAPGPGSGPRGSDQLKAVEAKLERLEAVEAKLDRVLRKIEELGSSAASPAASARASKRIDRADAPGRGAAGSSSARTTAEPAGRGGLNQPGPDGLRALELRLDRLLQKLDAGDSPDAPRSAVAPGAHRASELLPALPGGPDRAGGGSVPSSDASSDRRPGDAPVMTRSPGPGTGTGLGIGIVAPATTPVDVITGRVVSSGGPSGASARARGGSALSAADTSAAVTGLERQVAELADRLAVLERRLTDLERRLAREPDGPQGETRPRR